MANNRRTIDNNPPEIWEGIVKYLFLANALDKH